MQWITTMWSWSEHPRIRQGLRALAQFRALCRSPRARPLLRLSCALVLLSGVFIAYELARARVPEHRAALERMVHAYTGLSVRFRELGLRWGWYGPEAVFRQVELGEPGAARPLLTAPELLVSFDVWGSFRSGTLQAAHIQLLSPNIDLQGEGPSVLPTRRTPTRTQSPPPTGRLNVLARWHGGHVDIEGGHLRLPDPSGGSLGLPIRSASLRRAGRQWSLQGQLFLPEPLGREARISLQLSGEITRLETLAGHFTVQGTRLQLPGWRRLLAGLPSAQRFLPLTGTGDLDLGGDFKHGELMASHGRLRFANLTLLSLPGPRKSGLIPARLAPLPARRTLTLERLRGQWALQRRGGLWEVKIDGLELGPRPSLPMPPAHLSVQLLPEPLWLSGHLEQAPLGPLLDIGRWLKPDLQMTEGLEGHVRTLAFEWDPHRPAGHQLQLDAHLEAVALQPPSQAFGLEGLAMQVKGSQSELTAQGESHRGTLRFAHDPEHPLTEVHIAQALHLRTSATSWELTASHLTLAYEHTRLAVHGTLTGGHPRRPAQVDVEGELRGADIPLLRQLFGDTTVRVFGAAASHLSAGQIEKAQLLLRGPLEAGLLLRDPSGFTGSLTLRDAVLEGGELWPDAQGVSARVDWRGPQLHAQLLAGHAGPFAFETAQAEWDALGTQPTRLNGRVHGQLQDVVSWLREHPTLAAYAPQIQDLDLAGDALLDLNVRVPPNAADPLQSEVKAVLNQGQLRPVAGLPTIEGLHGSLKLKDGRLARSTLTGRWLGGPVTLRLSQTPSHGRLQLSVAGHGILDASQFALRAGTLQAADLSGTSPWSGVLSFTGGVKQAPQWHAHAEAGLTAVASTLPEPLTKAAGTPLPLRVEARGAGSTATLQVSLGERIHGLLGLKQDVKASQDADPDWIIERGEVHLGAGPATWPRRSVLRVTGRPVRLDLPLYLALWQQLRHGHAAPAFQSTLNVTDLMIAGQHYPQAHLRLERHEDTDTLWLQSSTLRGEASWPLDPDGRAELRFDQLTLPDIATPGAGALILAALGPQAQVHVENLVWSGRSLGTLSGQLTLTPPAPGALLPASLDIENLALTGDSQQLQGTLRCRSGQCKLQAGLTTQDAAASLLDFGFRPELAAHRGTLTGELAWSLAARTPPLSTLEGHVSLELEDGSTQRPEGEAAHAAPFPLLAVPALVAGGPLQQPAPTDMRDPGAVPETAPAPASLRFTRLAGDFEVKAGEARTSNLHFDGDAEILIQGRLGLLRRDYDQQVWILRGQERLPAAVRRLGPTQGVAAVWLGLRGLFGGHREEGRAALHLQGSWDDPIVVRE